jgi:hypothetical protein
MGKSLLDLLDTHPFTKGFDPNTEKAGMLKPEPSSKFSNDNKQALDFVKKMPKVYGTDFIRITTSTDPHETKKAIKKGADKLGGALAGTGIVGLLAAGAIAGAAAFHPKFPDDWTIGEDGAPTGMEKNFYNGLINGDYAFGKRYNPYHNNNKTKLGNFLSANKTPDQAVNAIVPALKSAAVGLAIAGIGLGLSKLFSKGKKKGNAGSKPKKQTAKKPSNPGFTTIDKNNIPYFPSTLVINAGFTNGISYRNYSRLRAHKMKISGMDYLKSSADEIMQYLSPTLDSSKIPAIGKDDTHTLTNYYEKVFLNDTPQTANVGNIMVSAKMYENSFPIFARLQDIDTKNNTGKYTQNKRDNAGGRALDDMIGNYSQLVDKDGNAYTYPGPKDEDGFQEENLIDKSVTLSQRYGAGLNGVNYIPTIDTKNDLENKITFKHSDGMDNIVRYNTVLEPVSKQGNIDKILKNDNAVLNKATQTQFNSSIGINPYRKTKKEVLENDGYDIINLAINGITLLGTITGLSDNATPSWSDTKAIGSGFKFYLYDSWEREISFKFQMYAENKQQLDLIWNKAERIKNLTLPVPKKSLGVFGQIVPLEIGNIINTPYGFLTTCNLTVSDDSPWEITTGSQKPFIFEMDITYKVISNTDNTSYTFYS